MALTIRNQTEWDALPETERAAFATNPRLPSIMLWLVRRGERVGFTGLGPAAGDVLIADNSGWTDQAVEGYAERHGACV